MRSLQAAVDQVPDEFTPTAKAPIIAGPPLSPCHMHIEVSTEFTETMPPPSTRICWA